MHFEKHPKPSASRVENQRFRAIILISAYGNNPYFAFQIVSIAAQMTSDDLLVVADDGSRQVDWTPFLNANINYCIWTRLERLGSTRSYLDFLCNLDLKAKFYFLADQDDVWLPGKISTQIEACTSKDEASIAFCLHGWINFKENREIKKSDQKTPIPELSKAHYCFETPAPGMTLCITAKGRDILISKKAISDAFQKYLPHDRIICALLASSANLVICTKPLIRYRQHDNNQIGAPESNIIREWLRRLRGFDRMIQSVSHATYLSYKLNRLSGQSELSYKIQLLRSRLRSSWIDNILVKILILAGV